MAELSWGEKAKLLGNLLAVTATQSPAERAAQTLAQVSGMVRLSRTLVPYYRDRLPHIPAKITSFEDFAQLPLVTRDHIQEYRLRLHNNTPPDIFRSTGVATTSGSTGKPIETHGHPPAQALGQQLQYRLQRIHGFDFNARCAFIVNPEPSGRADPPEGARGSRPWGGSNGSGDSVFLNLLSDPKDQLDWLVRMKPKYLSTYPSNLQALVQLTQASGVRPVGLEKIVLSSEPASEELVALVSQEWGATCVLTYSAREVGLIAAGAPDKGGYHLQSENVYVEILDDGGNPCSPGVVGRIVVTTLQDLLRPLIRYEIGDYGEFAEESPDDSVTLPRLRRVVGRKRSMIRLPDGRTVWPHFEFASLLKVGGLVQWQLVQRKDLSILVRVVSRGAFSEPLRRAVTHVVQEGLPGVTVEVQPVKEIERTRRGKYLELISEL